MRARERVRMSVGAGCGSGWGAGCGSGWGAGWNRGAGECARTCMCIHPLSFILSLQFKQQQQKVRGGGMVQVGARFENSH